MEWNNTATSQGILQDIDFICSTNTATFTVADKTRSVNTWYHRCIAEILDSMDEWDFQGEVATADLVANQQEYPFPSDILKIKRVETDIDDDDDYQRAKPLDPGSYDDSIAMSADINSAFEQSEPYYDTFDQSLFLYPVPYSAVTDGLKIWYSENVHDFTAISTGWSNSAIVGNSAEPVLADPFHKILSLGPSLDYAQKNNLDHLVAFCKDELYGSVVRGNDRLGGIISKMKEFYSTRAADKIVGIKTKYFGMNFK